MLQNYKYTLILAHECTSIWIDFLVFDITSESLVTLLTDRQETPKSVTVLYNYSGKLAGKQTKQEILELDKFHVHQCQAQIEI